MAYKIINESPIELSNMKIDVKDLLLAVEITNRKFEIITRETRKTNLDIFSVIDFRSFSGMIGEAFAKELSLINNKLVKNPSLDGYPDLLQIATPEMKSYFDECGYADLIKYKYGGVEVKNTFGTKKSKSTLLMGDQRINNINKKLDWKAHHQETNNLIGLFSDYINNTPKIIALFYSDQLEPIDWQAIQKPKEGSAMTSFSTILPTGFQKLKNGLKICRNEQEYLDFFN